MTSHILDIFTNFIVHTISTLGYPGVAALMAIESAAIPLPSEIIMPFAGYVASLGTLNIWGVALAGAVGSSVGSAVTYWVGLWGGRPLIEKYGKFVLISENDLDIADKFFIRFGLLSTFIGRLLPVVRTFISVPAGIARVPFWKFLWYSFIGSFFWSLLLAYLGMKLGHQWMTLRERAHWLDIVIIVVIIVGVVWWVWRHIKNSRSVN